jgi:hypothetical protein
VLSSALFEVIKQVVLSWQVIVATAAFLLIRAMVNSTVNPPKPKPHPDKSTKRVKIKRPPKEKTALDNVDTEGLNLEENKE